ncbi:MAG TPA: DUF6285 domain-containing protein [Candidatus Eisenbacteria bacterium]|nr:DUF6285 domain-containing protein [Candidatus Eisenbacteria bacterium]
MQDRPTAIELLTAVREFLEQDVLPGLEGRKRFHALVAANVLSIVTRELQEEETLLVAEWRRLRDLLGVDETVSPGRLDGLRAAVRALTERLVRRIRAGDADGGAFGDAVRAHVRMTITEKLRVANPKLLGGAS